MCCQWEHRTGARIILLKWDQNSQRRVTSCLREVGRDPQDSEHLLWVVTELGGFCLLDNNCVNQWSQRLVFGTLDSRRSTGPKKGQARWLCPLAVGRFCANAQIIQLCYLGCRCFSRSCNHDQKDYSSLGVWRNTNLDPSISLL